MNRRVVVCHHDDVDGLISAAILGTVLRDGAVMARYIPVDHHLKDLWLGDRLPYAAGSEALAIVDFPYHPTAQIWFDHHPTTFHTPEYQADFETKKKFQPLLNWSPTAPSCAQQIYETLLPACPSIWDLEPLAEQASKIDQAKYESPAAAYDMGDPAVLFNHSLRLVSDGQKSEVVRRLVYGQTLPTILNTLLANETKQTITTFQQTIPQAERLVKLEGNVAMLDLVDDRLPFMRFVQYLRFPQAKYGITVYGQPDGIAISMGYNPWMKTENSIHLGELAKTLGGGGHANAAGAFFRYDKHPNPYFAAIVAARTALLTLNGKS